MKVQDIMTHHPVCCTPEMSLKDAARLMRQFNCGALPVVESLYHLAPVGIITDRDIVCRAVSEGRNPVFFEVESYMTRGCVTVTPQTSIEECRELLEKRRIRRVPVLDATGQCCGIVAVADFARKAPRHDAAKLVQQLSRAA